MVKDTDNPNRCPLLAGFFNQGETIGFFVDKPKIKYLNGPAMIQSFYHEMWTFWGPLYLDILSSFSDR